MQLGHTTTKMVDEHYGKWIKEKKPNMAKLVSELLKKNNLGTLEPHLDDRKQQLRYISYS